MKELLEAYDSLIEYCYLHGNFSSVWVFEQMSSYVRQLIVKLMS